MGARVVAAAAVVLAATSPGAADPLPPGSIGMVVGAASGTFADAKRLGVGYQIGAQAAWQPMHTENRVGLAFKWSFVFGSMYNAAAASVGDELRTFQMDIMFGVRIRPGTSPTRYLTMRAGGQLLRTDQVVPSSTNDLAQRAFAGAVASVGIDQYAWGLLFNLDVRASQIGTGPTILAVMFGVAKTGP
jgi:hypothetical protein